MELGIARGEYPPDYLGYLRDLLTFDIQRGIESAYGMELNMIEFQIEVYLEQGKLAERQVRELRLDTAKRKDALAEQEKLAVLAQIERSESHLMLDVSASSRSRLRCGTDR